ncbi:hypothetical protein ACIRPH_31550 [Nocardiopsis sp. NPDC101807]|uniref:hypothetical protein n=1 Tax=Nocardiopsis sp. NPDC101807 TaxID=3364339 RepID=UPI00382C8A57
MSTTTTTSRAQTVREHPEVRRAHQLLQRALDGSSDPGLRRALSPALDALRTDPTLALTTEGQRTLDLLAELARQLRPLSRQAEMARTHARLLADPDLEEADRAHAINRLGKINPAAITNEAELVERLCQQAQELADRARPDWQDPDHLHGLARRMLPPVRDLDVISQALRSSVSRAAAVVPDAPEVRRLLNLADQIHP